MNLFNEAQPPFPPFTLESAIHKTRAMEDDWNSRDPNRVVQRCTENTLWRNCTEFFYSREEVRSFLQRKWAMELDHRRVSEVWGTRENRMAVRFASEWHDDSGQWFRSYGNEVLEFNERGLIQRRYASINDLPIRAEQRLFQWPSGRRPDDHPGLTDLGL